MQDLIAGIKTFQREVYPKYRELLHKLAEGQSPEALVIACSDSRVDPSLFMNTKPGQLFVIRNAGNFVPKYDGTGSDVAASIEFAVVALKVPNIIVCGHTHCGAIKGLLHPDSLKSLPLVADWVRHATPARDILARAGRSGGPDELQQAVDANVLVQLDNLRTHPSVAEALAAKQVTLHGWVYDIASGGVRAYNDQWKEFAAL